MSCRLFALALLLSPLAQASNVFSIWRGGGCVGGPRCGRDSVLSYALPAGTCLRSVDIFAHGGVGPTRRGALRVELGERVLDPELEIGDEPRWKHVAGHGFSGRAVTLRPAVDGESVVLRVRLNVYRGYGCR